MMLRRHLRRNITKLADVSGTPKEKVEKKEVKSNATPKTKKPSGKSK